MKTRTAFGEELRRLRREAGKSLADMADALECSITYVSDIERGKKNPPSRENIVKLAQCLRQMDQLTHLLALAAVSRKSIEITVPAKNDELAMMLSALARRCDEGGLDEATVEKILKLLEKEDH